MKNMKEIIIVFLIIIVLILLLLLNIKNRDKNISENEIITEGEAYSEKLEALSYRNFYFVIKEIIENYIENVKKINGDFYKGDQEEDKLKLEGITYIKNTIDKDCIEKTKITEQQIIDEANTFVQNGKYEKENIEYTLIFNNIYVKKINDTQNAFIVDLTVNKISFNIVIKLDYKNNTFSLFSDEYINNIDIPKNDIENNNDYNIFTSNLISDEDMAREYFRLIKETMQSDKQKMYNHLEPEYKKSTFEHFEDFEKYLDNNFVNIKSSKLTKYAVEQIDKVYKYTLIDNNNNVFLVYVSDILNYQLIINPNN